MKHLSVRVAWHDNKWNGTVCKCPLQNTYCNQLPKIAQGKDVSKEIAMKGKDWSEIPSDQLPPCKAESGTFMNSKAYKRLSTHVYASHNNLPHKVLLPTENEVPPYSFWATPFRYMLRSNQEDLDKKYPNMPLDEDSPFYSDWVYGEKRQRAILKEFRKEIVPNLSDVVFYCKNGNPVDEECQRLIVGIGEITKLYPIVEYNTTGDYTYPYWDNLMSHSIRQDLKESAGFLLPYHEYLAMSESMIKDKTGKTKYQCLDEIKLSLDKLGGSRKMLDELSYGCDYISNNDMLIILNAAKRCLENVKQHKLVGGDWDKQLRWIDGEIGKVKKHIGPFPSFADALSAAGFEYAYMIEQDLYAHHCCGIKDNPWLAFEKLLNEGYDLGNVAYKDRLPYYRDAWNATGRKEKEFLMFLSRIELSTDQILSFYDNHDTNFFREIIENPYLLCEHSNLNIPESIVTTEMIDSAFIPDVDKQGSNTPVVPSVVTNKIDRRRIRSLIIYRLKEALLDGDTLLSEKEISDYLNDIFSDDQDKIPMGYLSTVKDFMSEKISYLTNDNGTSLQLKAYTEEEEYLSRVLIARAKNPIRQQIQENWKELIISSLENFNPKDERSTEAVKDQVKALEIMANRRLSVLTGPAGTGKTKVVEAFLKSNKIANGGVLLLAPTGKARVRLGKMANREAYTLAQFFVRQNCFNGKTMMPEFNDDSKEYSGANTVIVDECSMLTIDDFYCLFNLLDFSTVKRVVLIGDPYQLPPIGPGRPFADLCNYLKTHSKAPEHASLAELRTVVRTTEHGKSDILALASWFSGEKPDKSGDAIFDKIANDDLNNDLSVYTWQDTDDIKKRLITVLGNEFRVDANTIANRLILAMGLDDLTGIISSPEKVEGFQILTPVRNPMWGSIELNSDLQDILDITNRNGNHIEIGNQKIYRKDKVIQLVNEKRDAYIHKDKQKTKRQLSNGQIGCVYNINNKSGYANAVFAGYPGITFGYKSQRGEDVIPSLELAYAITIHKSQGSDFDTVLVVLPKSGRILSRELVYTALTRAKKRLILFVQDDTSWLKGLSSPDRSIVALRNSNLFGISAVRENKKSIPYVEGLIHTTTDKNLIVRSKSEVIIANQLIAAGLKHGKDFYYEKELIAEDGSHRLPDFTFTSDSGDTLLWEHLGMMNIPSYKRAWEEKLKFYNSIGFNVGDNLFITEDHEDGSIKTPEIMDVIEKVKKRMEE